MRLVFSSSRRRPGRIDDDLEGEAEAARRAGFVAQAEPVPGEQARGEALYRGWMRTGEEYRALFARCEAAGLALLTRPEAYEEAHYLPLGYPRLEGLTAESAWSEGRDLSTAWLAARRLGPGPLFVKDWVKSAKRRWPSACVIDDVEDRRGFEQVCEALLAERGERFNRGFVFRRVLPLRAAGLDAWGRPAHQETRCFFWQGEALELPGWGDLPDPWRERLSQVAASFASPFVALDTAQEEGGRWRVIEAGDGGVTGVPPAVSDEDFYRALAARAGQARPRSGALP